MCVNTLITTIKQKSVEGLGYYFADALRPRHWFQFADDSAVTTANEEDNQLLLNLFTKWCTWANLKITVDKCHTFRIRKTATMACQYKPLLLVNNQRIPPVELDESFKYQSMTPPNLMVMGLQIRKLHGTGVSAHPPPSVLPDYEKSSLFRVNRALMIFFASRLGFLISFYFASTDHLLKSS